MGTGGRDVFRHSRNGAAARRLAVFTNVSAIAALVADLRDLRRSSSSRASSYAIDGSARGAKAAVLPCSRS
jgi:hypothetical protein